ncbi:MAG: hypothetical protein ACTSU6_02085 [Candidatus Njordarchaeales archaeon]
MNFRNTLEKRKISKHITHTVFRSIDEEILFLMIEFKDKDKSFSIERMFKNNQLGIINMGKEMQKLNTGEKILNYLGLGDNNV